MALLTFLTCLVVFIPHASGSCHVNCVPWESAETLVALTTATVGAAADIACYVAAADDTEIPACDCSSSS